MRNPVRSVCGALLALLLLPACGLIDPKRDDDVADPDRRLERYLEEYEQARLGELREKIYEEEEHVLVDTGLLRSRIDEMCFLFPHHAPSFMANAVLAYYDDKDRERAQVYLDQLLRLEPVHPQAAMLRARIACEEGNLPLGRTLLDEQIRLTPDHAGLRETSAMVHGLMNHPDAALEDLDLAERFGAPVWRIAYHRGLVYEDLGQHDAAAEQYAAALAANPAFAKAQSRLAALR